MKIKLDENLPEGLVSVLSALGHDVDTVRAEGIAGRDDATVWSFAQADGPFLITQDLDFSDTRKFGPGVHGGLLLVRLPRAGRLELIRRIKQLFRVEDVESWTRCFVVMTEHKVRVLRP